MRRCIARKLLIVNSQTVTLCIVIDEETGLEEGIRRVLNVRDQVGRSKGELVYRQHRDYQSSDEITNLLNLVKVIFRIPVQDELANRVKREFGLGPGFSNIKRDATIRSLCLSACHRLLHSELE